MRILITSGLSSHDVGGTAQYGSNLATEFERAGHKAKLYVFGKMEKALPSWIRHLYFLIKIFPEVMRSDAVLALDVYSTGVPTVVACWILRKRSVVRVGGDFLWESYINRTGKNITLPEFYKVRPTLNFKERLISFFLNFTLIKIAGTLVFNTEWQRKIWKEYYNIPDENSSVVRNYIPQKSQDTASADKNFLWAGRNTKVKNLETLKEVVQEVKYAHPEFNLEIISNISHEELQERIKKSYAVILPSISDVCPNLILEAASFGKPFIMTRETGLTEIYDKGGIFVNPLDRREIYLAIEKMLQEDSYNRYRDELAEIDVSRGWNEVASDILKIAIK